MPGFLQLASSAAGSAATGAGTGSATLVGTTSVLYMTGPARRRAHRRLGRTAASFECDLKATLRIYIKHDFSGQAAPQNPPPRQQQMNRRIENPKADLSFPR
jgi:hypothetical protein